MDIPADVQAKIDEISNRIDELNFDKQFISGANARGRNDELKNDLYSQMQALRSPYLPREDKKSRPWWDGESSESKAKRVAIVVQRALKQEKEGRL